MSEQQHDKNWRPVFIVSDGTAITAETLAHSVMTQFPDLVYDQQRPSSTRRKRRIRSQSALSAP